MAGCAPSDIMVINCNRFDDLLVQSINQGCHGYFNRLCMSVCFVVIF